MAYFKSFTSAAALIAMAGAAQAQIHTQVEAVPSIETEVVRAQFIREGDVSPEEYAALLAEADKIRAFQTNSGSYTGISSSAVSSAGHITTDSHGYQIELFEAPTTSADFSSTSYATTVEPVITQSATTYPMAKTYPLGTDFSSPEFLSQNATTSYAATTYSGTSAGQVVTSSLPSVTYSSPVTTYQNTSASSHYVVKGDTLYNVAKRNGVSVSALKAENGLSSNNISLGQSLRIPGASRVVSVESQSFSAPVTNAANTTVTSQPYKSSSRPTLVRNVEPLPAGNIYAVASKDTLYSISRRACVSVSDLRAVNGNIDAKSLQLGQRLTLPGGHCLR